MDANPQHKFAYSKMLTTLKSATLDELQKKLHLIDLRLHELEKALSEMTECSSESLGEDSEDYKDKKRQKN